MQLPRPIQETHATHLNPVGLALGFGIASVVLIVLFGVITSSMWGMMGTSGSGWMMGGRPGFGGGSMIQGYGSFAFFVIWGSIGVAIAGGVAALVYNAFMKRQA